MSVGSLRVVLLNQYYAPDEAATAQILADLGAGFAAGGCRVTAVCSSRAYASPSLSYPPRETIAGVEVRRVRSTAFGRGTRLGRLVDYLTFYLGAAALLARSGPSDAVISLTTPPLVALLGLAAARLGGAASVCWVMDLYPDLAFELGVMSPKSLTGRSLARLSSSVLGACDRVIALDEAMAERLRSVGIDEVSVVHNWADGDTIRPKPREENELRRSWGWGSRFVVLYSGNMGLAHEFSTVLDAAERLRDRPDLLFAFVGGGPRLGEVRDEAERRGLPNVEFRPYVARERLGDSLTAGDVHLVTLRERMPGLLVPSKIYGILAAGRPTLYVGPQSGAVAEIVRDGRCGTLVDIGDGEALARIVLSYVGDPGRVAEEGTRARTVFDADYTRASAVAALRAIVEETVGRRRRRALSTEK